MIHLSDITKMREHLVSEVDILNKTLNRETDTNKIKELVKEIKKINMCLEKLTDLISFYKQKENKNYKPPTF